MWMDVKREKFDTRCARRCNKIFQFIDALALINDAVENERVSSYLTKLELATENVGKSCSSLIDLGSKMKRQFILQLYGNRMVF